MRIEVRTTRYAPHMPERECAFLDGLLMRTRHGRAFSYPMVLLLKPLARGRTVSRLELLEANGFALDQLHVFEERLSRLRKELAPYNLCIKRYFKRGYRLEKIPEELPSAA